MCLDVYQGKLFPIDASYSVSLNGIKRLWTHVEFCMFYSSQLKLSEQNISTQNYHSKMKTVSYMCVCGIIQTKTYKHKHIPIVEKASKQSRCLSMKAFHLICCYKYVHLVQHQRANDSQNVLRYHFKTKFFWKINRQTI